MNLSLGCAFNLEDLFLNFKNSKLDMDCGKCEKLTGDRHRDKLAQKVFMDSVQLILNDVIDNNVTFQLPLNGVKAELYVKRYTGEEFAKLRKRGKWQDVDFLKSFFTGY